MNIFLMTHLYILSEDSNCWNIWSAVRMPSRKVLLVIETTSHYSSSSSTNQESLASSISSRENYSRALLSLDKLSTFESHVL